jgi:hypothetical protein
MTKLHEIGGTSDPARVGDALFIHGLDGDSITTWHPSKRFDALWPKWLGSDLPEVGVWSLDYEGRTLVRMGAPALLESAQRKLRHNNVCNRARSLYIHEQDSMWHPSIRWT